MSYQLVFFDLDGTLLDFETAQVESLIATLQAFNLPSHDTIVADYIRINHTCWQQMEHGELEASRIPQIRISTLFLQYGITADVDAFNAHYRDTFAGNAILIDGATDILRYAQGRPNLQVVALTNGLKNMQHDRLRNANIAKYFDAVYTSEELDSFKPHTAMFVRAYEKLGLPLTQRNALIVGDSLTSDIKGGNDFGIDTCWYNPNGQANPGGPTPVYQIAVLNELKRIL